MDPTPFSRRVLVTGGAGGPGLGCARRFRELGYAVTIVDVDADAGRAAAAELDGDARGEPPDVLVNNAGIYPPSHRTLTHEGHELTFAIAHLGHFRLTQALWPSLSAASAARLVSISIVSISSLVQRRSQLYLDDPTLGRNYEPIRACGQAKLSCLLFATELQRRLSRAASRVASFAAHPGVCRTQLGRRRRRSDRDSAWQRFSSWALAWSMSHCGQTPEQCAETVVLAATTDRFPPGSLPGPTGLLESAGPVNVAKPGRAASDPALASALWDLSERLTGIRWTI